MRRIFLGAILAPLFLSIAFAKDAKLEKVYKAFDRVEVLPAIKEKPVSERLHILCGALAVYREAQGEDFESKKLEADVAFYSAKSTIILLVMRLQKKADTLGFISLWFI